MNNSQTVEDFAQDLTYGPNQKSNPIRMLLWARARGLTHVEAYVDLNCFPAFEAQVDRLHHEYGSHVIDHLTMFRNADSSRIVVSSQPYHSADPARIATCYNIVSDDGELWDACATDYDPNGSWYYPGQCGHFEFLLKGSP